MDYRRVAGMGLLALGLAAGACNRQPLQSHDETTPVADRRADLQREREQQVAELDKRVADIDRQYAEANEKGDKATAGLREELKEDVTNVKEAVSDLKTTTPDNWWERHEAVMNRTADDIEVDVRRVAGNVTYDHPRGTTGTAGEAVSTAPFTSRRDRFVADLKARIEAMEKALDNVKTKGVEKTEIADTRARVKKLREDVDRLQSASADDWWDVSKTRVTEYLDRVEGSIKRLDNDKG